MIKAFMGRQPAVAPTCMVAETAAVIGSVSLEDEVNVWFGAVLRGDECNITVGRGSNIQDNAVLHGDGAHDVTVGEYVTVGHGAIVHGCTVGSGALIGMGATVLNGAVIGEGCIIGAGALVKENDVIPAGSLAVGVPAKIVRSLTPAQIASNRENAEEYLQLMRQYAQNDR